MRRAIFSTSELCPESALRSNWIDQARLALALLVLFSHSYPITRGTNDTEPLAVLSHGQTSFGAVAVDLFFIISGFLIVRSWLCSRSMEDYLHRRVLRIHPGYAVAVLVSLGLALMTCAHPMKYLHDLPKRTFVLNFLNLGAGALDVPAAAFQGNPFYAVNGSLWTIQIEFFAYIGVAIYGLFGLYRLRSLWAVLALAVLARYARNVLHGENSQANWGFACCFVSGASFYLFRDLIPRSAGLCLIALVVLAVSVFFPPCFPLFFPVTGAYALFYLTLLPTHPWTRWTKNFDLSYGTYLYAFVIQQSLVFWFHMRGPVLLFLVATPITLLCATLSWLFVERPFLRLKRCTFSDYDPGRKLPAADATAP